MRFQGSAIVLILLLFDSLAHAGKYNEVLSIGDKAPPWKELTDVVTGKKHSLGDLKGAQVVVVVFTCNSCPVATDYEDRILKLAEKYNVSDDVKSAKAGKPSASQGGVELVAINVNRVKDDLPPAMKARALKKKYPFPYLYDETQQIARDFGANFTPQFFVLDGQRRVVYMGAMDDDSDESKVKQRYVGPAIEAALAGKSVEISETAPVGCRIRFARQR
jgi:thiol-disulfide isomerase/thioredoxin